MDTYAIRLIPTMILRLSTGFIDFNYRRRDGGVTDSTQLTSTAEFTSQNEIPRVNGVRNAFLPPLPRDAWLFIRRRKRWSFLKRRQSGIDEYQACLKMPPEIFSGNERTLLSIFALNSGSSFTQNHIALSLLVHWVIRTLDNRNPES